MPWHFAPPAKSMVITPHADRDQSFDVLAIAWDDEHQPNDNDLREFRFLVLRDGAKRPSWILGTEVGELHLA